MRGQKQKGRGKRDEPWWVATHGCERSTDDGGDEASRPQCVRFAVVVAISIGRAFLWCAGKQCLDKQPPFESSRSIEWARLSTQLDPTRIASTISDRAGPDDRCHSHGAHQHQAPQHQEEATLQWRNGRPPPAPPARGRPRLQFRTDRSADTGTTAAAAAAVAAGPGARARAAHGPGRGVGGAGAAPGAERAGGPVSLACAWMGFDLTGWLDWLWVVRPTTPVNGAAVLVDRPTDRFDMHASTPKHQVPRLPLGRQRRVRALPPRRDATRFPAFVINIWRSRGTGAGARTEGGGGAAAERSGAIFVCAQGKGGSFVLCGVIFLGSDLFINT